MVGCLLALLVSIHHRWEAKEKNISWEKDSKTVGLNFYKLYKMIGNRMDATNVVD